MSHAFISYSRQDKDFVAALTATMKAAGRETWVDWERIPPSVRWLEEIYAAIDASAAFVFVISPASAKSEVCIKELDYAVNARKRILPIVAEATPDVDARLAEINWIAFPTPDDPAAMATLFSALDTDPAWVARHTRLQVRAREWERSGRDASFLLRGADLTEAESWLSDAAQHAEPSPTNLHTEYIVASRTSQTRVQRLQVWSAVGAAVVALGLAVWAFIERNTATDNAALARRRQQEAEVQQARAVAGETKASENAALAEERRREAERQAARARAIGLAGQAAGQLAIDPEVALQLAVVSLQAQPSPEGVDALVRSFAASRLAATFGGACFVVQAAFDTEETGVLARCRDGTVARFDAQGTLRWQTTSRLARADALAVDALGHAYVLAGAQGLIVLDAKTGRRVKALGIQGRRYTGLTVDRAHRRVYAFGPDATGVAAFDARTLAALPMLAPDVQGVRWVRPSADGRRLAVLGQRGGPTAVLAVSYYDAASAAWVADLGGAQISLQGARFNEAGDRLVMVGDEMDPERQPEVWDLKSHTSLGMLARPAGRFVAVAIDEEDGVYIGTPGGPVFEYWMRRRSPDSYVRMGEFSGHEGAINQLVARQVTGGHQVLSASADGTARLWDVFGDRKERARLIGHLGPVQEARFAADGRTALTTSLDGTAKLWRLGSQVQDAAFFASEPGTQLGGLDAQGQTLLILRRKGRPFIYDAVQRKVLATLAVDPRAIGSVEPSTPATVALSEDGSRAVVIGRKASTAQVFDTASGREVARFPTEGNTFAARFSADGRQLLVMGGAAKLVDPDTGRTLGRLPGLRTYINSEDVAMHPDGRRFFVRDSGQDAVVHWASPGTARGKVWPVGKPVAAMALSPSGRMLATAEREGPVTIWDVDTQRVLQRLDFNAQSLAFSPDSDRLVAEDLTGSLRVWTPDDATELFRLFPSSAPYVQPVRYSTDGRLLLTSSGVRLASTGFLVDGEMSTLRVSGDGLRHFDHQDDRVSVIDCLACLPAESLLPIAKTRLARPALTPVEARRLDLVTRSN